MRVGVVGAGQHANSVLYPAILETGLNLVAVCARTESRAQMTAQRWGASSYYTSVDDMLSVGGLDGVVVAVPPDAYRPIVVACLEAGLPVFCEKPGGQSARELRELDGLASAANLAVVVGYMKRFAPAYVEARDLIHDSRFGAPSMAHFTFAMGQVAGWLANPGDYLVDNPVHMIDLARYLVGELSDVIAVMHVVPDFGLAVSVIARADGGAACSFNFCTTASFAHQGESAEVYGRAHAVRVDNVDTCVYRPGDAPAQVWRPNYTLPVATNMGLTTMGFIPALSHFREVVAGRATNEAGLESAARTLDTAEVIWSQLEPSWRALQDA